MTAPAPSAVRWRAWALAGGVALAAWGLGSAVFPGGRTPASGRALTPAAPRIVMAASAGGSAGERALRLDGSPSLIALAEGLPLPGGRRHPGGEIVPPAALPPAPPAELRPPSAGGTLDPIPDTARLARGDAAGEGSVFAKLAGAPLPSSQPPAPARSPSLVLSGGLAGKQVAVEGWSWEPWMRGSAGWSVSLELQADEQGRVTQVLLDEPSADPGLNESLVQGLYRRGRVLPAGPCRGAIRISFSGNR